MILFDRRDSGGLEKWFVAGGEGEGNRPFFQNPLNPEIQIVSLSPEGLVIIWFIVTA